VCLPGGKPAHRMGNHAGCLRVFRCGLRARLLGSSETRRRFTPVSRARRTT
jgi:hypothetical protein